MQVQMSASYPSMSNLLILLCKTSNANHCAENCGHTSIILVLYFSIKIIIGPKLEFDQVFTLNRDDLILSHSCHWVRPAGKVHETFQIYIKFSLT